MLRLELDAADLGDLRVSKPWGPLTESLFSLVSLQRRQPTVLTEGWRQRVRRGLGDRAVPLLALMRPSCFVDFHTFIGRAPTLDEGLEALRAVPAERLRRELLWALPVHLHREQAWVRSWLRQLAGGDPVARRDLVDCLRDYHERAIGPYWERIRPYLDADRAHRARVMAEGGINQLLATLHPAVRWRPPFLELRRPVEWVGRQQGDVLHRLEGRSLLLVPSVCVDHPTVYGGDLETGSPSLLFYPVLREPAEALAIVATENGSGRHALSALLGDSRAAALGALAEPCMTTELGRRIGVSPATASYHVRALREAGLVVTRRIGQAVLHSLTPTGAQLLDGHLDGHPNGHLNGHPDSRLGGVLDGRSSMRER